MSLWFVIPLIIVVWLGSFSAGVERGKREIADRIERERNEASKLSDADKAAVLALLYQAKDLAYESETQVFSPEWEGALKSIDELRYLWRYKDPVKWVSKEGFEHED
ncbi:MULTISPECIES: hypothetical protein [Klebsiella]|uniref:hypothetical protein n=1 Tax=Klebsiella TaxID=570 RepID=UPI001C014E34|nr:MULTISPECIES: hypothetical protein [Klebsiella]MBT9335053.1 hypothetical protein [Klebsiella sp. O852]MCZ0714337.1 hypothetical protein [Klebsiella quasipneumoniae]